MAGGGLAPNTHGKQYPGKLTARVILTSTIAATGGLIFGYDLGISGGVTSMDSFLEEFFPQVYKKEAKIAQSDNQYCTFDSEILTLFTSSLYLAALFASIGGSHITRSCGRRITMMLGGLLFAGGAMLNGFAKSLWMLIVGRMLLGFGIGCANQSVPIYLSEISPYKYRGALNAMFQFTITVGILIANALNYFFAQIKGGWGWRLSLGGAVVPALIIFLGALVLPESPNSLIERGHLEEAKNQLKRLRGVENVDDEFYDIVAASEAAKQVRSPWKNILFNKKYRPQCTFAILIPMLQQLTGMNVIVFYAPVLFKTIGFGSSAALMSSLITGAVNMVATLVSIATLDKFGRRALFMEGGTQMFISQVIITSAIAAKFGWNGNPGEISKVYAFGVVGAICVFVAGFAWSWGPLGWLVPSEIFPLEVRSAGQSITVSTNMIFTFLVAQIFTWMLCHLRYGLFIFFGTCVFIATVIIYKFLPETKGVPIEDMTIVWQKHPFWKRYYKDSDETDAKLEMGSKE